MSVEILLLVVLAELTLVAYIIAINSHGPTRLAFSYLLATIILAGSVWATVQYVNTGLNLKKMEEFKRLEMEKQKAEDQMHSGEKVQETLKERMAAAAKLSGVVTAGTTLSTLMMNTDLRDMATDLDGLVGKSIETKRRADELAGEFDKLKFTDKVFSESTDIIKEGLKVLAEAAQYFVLYYKAEDSAQEELRERIMRQKARQAHETLQKASSLIASLNTQ
jgi:hypothetical protein